MYSSFLWQLYSSVLRSSIEKEVSTASSSERYKNRVKVIHRVHGFVIQNIRLDGAGENLSNDVIQFFNMNSFHLKILQPAL